MARTVKVFVVAPEGRFYPRYGGRECGAFYTLPKDAADALLAADPGLSADPPGAKGKPALADKGEDPNG